MAQSQLGFLEFSQPDGAVCYLSRNLFRSLPHSDLHHSFLISTQSRRCLAAAGSTVQLVGPTRTAQCLCCTTRVMAHRWAECA